MLSFGAASFWYVRIQEGGYVIAVSRFEIAIDRLLAILKKELPEIYEYRSWFWHDDLLLVNNGRKIRIEGTLWILKTYFYLDCQNTSKLDGLGEYTIDKSWSHTRYAAINAPIFTFYSKVYRVRPVDPFQGLLLSLEPHFYVGELIDLDAEFSKNSFREGFSS